MERANAQESLDYVMMTGKARHQQEPIFRELEMSSLKALQFSLPITAMQNNEPTPESHLLVFASPRWLLTHSLISLRNSPQVSTVVFTGNLNSRKSLISIGFDNVLAFK